MKLFPLDILILAVVAAIIGFKLKNTLGKRVGHEQTGVRVRGYDVESSSERIIRLPDVDNPPQDKPSDFEDIGSPELAAKIIAIREQDPSFNPHNFLKGAKIAFEMVVNAFSKGDKKALSSMLSPELFKKFSAQIDADIADGIITETTVVAVNDAIILDVFIKGKVVHIDMQFDSEQIIVGKNSEGEIVEGDVSDIDKISEIWSFERAINSNKPDWILTATKAA